MASAELSRRVEKVVGYPPLSELGELQSREFHEALLEADSFEDVYDPHSSATTPYSRSPTAPRASARRSIWASSGPSNPLAGLAVAVHLVAALLRGAPRRTARASR